MRNYDEAVKIVVGEGRSLNEGERQKAVGPYDAIYLRDRIKHHNRRLNLRRGVVFVLYFSLMVAVYTVFFYPVDDTTAQAWLKGTVIFLSVLSVLGIPFLVFNHGRNASVLRVVRKLRQAEGEQSVASAAGAGKEARSAAQPGEGAAQAAAKE